MECKQLNKLEPNIADMVGTDYYYYYCWNGLIFCVNPISILG